MVNVTRLESVVVDLIAQFMNCNILSALVALHGQQFSSKINTLRALYSIGMKTRDEANADPIMKKFAKAQTLADYRNTIVHAYWVLDSDGTPLAVRWETRGFFQRKRLPIVASQIRAKAREVAALEKELRGLRDYLKKQKGREKEPNV